VTINDRAKTHYDNACIYQAMAHQHAEDEHVNLAMVYSELASVSVKLAVFAAEFHAIVAGIDTDVPDVNHPTQTTPQGLWGGPPKT
jgi:hypothetical protein